MTVPILMVMVGSLLLLPLLFLLGMFSVHVVADFIYGFCLSHDDLIFGLCIGALSLLGAGLVWAGASMLELKV